VLILGVGLVAERDLLGDPGLEDAVDHLSRMSAGVVLALALVTWAASALATCVREVATSKALDHAVARGASRSDVPSPEQAASVTGEPTAQLTFFAWANAALAGLLGVVGLIVMAVDRADAESLLIFSLITGYAAVMCLVGWAAPRWLGPAHARRRARIVAHWSPMEAAHQGRTRAAGADPRSPRPAEGLPASHARRRMHPLARVGAAMSGVGSVFGMSSYLVGQGMGLGSEDVFAGYRTESLVAMVVSVGMFVAALIGSGVVDGRGREFRNALMRRWPAGS
jgi:hypothetical protein